jgi:hypothetical protein
MKIILYEFVECIFWPDQMNGREKLEVTLNSFSIFIKFIFILMALSSPFAFLLNIREVNEEKECIIN